MAGGSLARSRLIYFVPIEISIKLLIREQRMSNASVAVTRDDEVLVVDDATIERTSGAFDAIEPFSGIAKAGRSYNFAGALLPEHMTQDWPEARDPGMRKTSRPEIHDGEVFAEWYSIVRSIDLARDNYLMISLGAHLGVPIVNAHKILQQYKPMPSRFIGVEADEHMSQLLQKNLVENEIDPTAVTLNQVIISDSNQPKMFTVCSKVTGLNRMMSKTELEQLCTEILAVSGASEVLIEKLLHRATTGFIAQLDNLGEDVELKMLSSLTVADVIGSHPRVDFLEIDIQGAEYVALPPAIQTLNERVAWLHLGTHAGEDAHKLMRDLFTNHEWEFHIDWVPDSVYETPTGHFKTSDGVLSMRNPRLT